MAKIKVPLLGLDVEGSIAKTLSFRKGRARNGIVMVKPTLVDTATPAQLLQRQAFLDAVALWNALSLPEKASWNSAGSRRNTTGYALFLHEHATRPPPPPVEELFEHWDSGFAVIPVWNLNWQAQTFMPLDTHTITKARLKIYWVGFPQITDVIVSIKDIDGVGHPVGPDLTVVNEPGIGIDIFPNTWHDFVFPTNPTLTAGITYAIVVRCPILFAPMLLCQYDPAVGAYPRGNKLTSFDAGATWIDTFLDDHEFEEYGFPA